MSKRTRIVITLATVATLAQLHFSSKPASACDWSCPDGSYAAPVALNNGNVVPGCWSVDLTDTKDGPLWNNDGRGYDPIDKGNGHDSPHARENDR